MMSLPACSIHMQLGVHALHVSYRKLLAGTGQQWLASTGRQWLASPASQAVSLYRGVIICRQHAHNCSQGWHAWDAAVPWAGR